MKTSSLKFAAFAAFFAVGQSLWALPSITNGSLTGPIANGGVPSGWTTISQSPDTMDQAHNVGVTGVPYGATPSGASPDGGTWIGFANGSGGFQEIFGQLVTGFTVGETYELSWYEANFGANIGYIGANSIAVTIGGSYAGSGSLLGLSPNWSSDSLTFVAAASSLQINFGLTNDVSSYLSIDGIKLQQASSGVPDGASTTLLLGFAGLAFVGLRRKLTRA